MATTTINELDDSLCWFIGVAALNFVETMALYRAFSVGRFKCSGTSPKIIAADYLTEGYNLVVDKDATKIFCLGCIKNFAESEFHVTEDENYLVVRSQ